jgi:adenylyltransferase/sulfurtransferase
VLSPADRISAADFSESRRPDHLLVDVRTEPELLICAIENSVNIPMADLDKEETLDKLSNLLTGKSELIVVCRRGNDSQLAVERLRKRLPDSRDRFLQNSISAKKNSDKFSSANCVPLSTQKQLKEIYLSSMDNNLAF